MTLMNESLCHTYICQGLTEECAIAWIIDPVIQFRIENIFEVHELVTHKKSYHINSNTSWNNLVQKSQKKQCLYMPDPCAYLININ